METIFELEFSYLYMLDDISISDSPKSMMKVVVFIILRGIFRQDQGMQWLETDCTHSICLSRCFKGTYNSYKIILVLKYVYVALALM